MRRFSCGLLVAGCVFGVSQLRAAEPAGFAVEARADRLVVTDGGRPVAEFVVRDDVVRRPYLSQLHAPGGLRATRQHPPREGHDALDHPTMHPGLWFAVGSLSGEDYWRNRAEMRHERFVEPTHVEPDEVRCGSEGLLLRADGRRLGTHRHLVTLRRGSAGYMVRLRVELRGESEPLVFGDQEEMGFGVRVATPLAEVAGGRVTAADGRRGAKTIWGTRAAWCDYSGTSEGRFVGVLLLPDADNPRPAWWHTREYGLMVANPFGRRSLDAESASPELVVPAGQTLSLGVTAIVHASESADGFDAEAAVRDARRAAAKAVPATGPDKAASR